MADYVFIETVSEQASPVTRYEVRCGKCGEHYGEESRPLLHAPVAVAVEPPIVWPPDREPVPPRDWRQDVRDRATGLAAHAGRLRGEATTIARTSARGIRAIAERVPRRWFGRAGHPGAAADDRDGQTGG
ncbi:MAG: hypothetical protein SW019_01715 [Actinomycetota bacterium]|nr:hypothetical protein [Actinomycetota bacterium]